MQQNALLAFLELFMEWISSFLRPSAKVHQFDTPAQFAQQSKIEFKSNELLVIDSVPDRLITDRSWAEDPSALEVLGRIAKIYRKAPRWSPKPEAMGEISLQDCRWRYTVKLLQACTLTLNELPPPKQIETFTTEIVIAKGSLSAHTITDTLKDGRTILIEEDQKVTISHPQFCKWLRAYKEIPPSFLSFNDADPFWNAPNFLLSCLMFRVHRQAAQIYGYFSWRVEQETDTLEIRSLTGNAIIRRPKEWS